MRVLITGGAGYIGMSLIHRLMADDSITEVVIYDNMARSNYAFFVGERYAVPGKCTFVRGELMDSRLLTSSLRGIDVVIHLAAKVSTPFSDSDAHAYDQVNHWGSAQLANAVEENGVGRVIYLSSASVYGSTEMPVNEHYAPSPNTFYGISKLAGEKKLRRLQDSCEVYILRAANVYGYNPAMRIDAVLNKFLFLANYHGRISVEGDGQQYRAFIHVDKLAQTLEQLCTVDMKPGIYNLCEHNLTIQNLVREVRLLYPELEVLSINHNMPLRSIQVETQSKILDHIALDQRSLQDELGDMKSHFRF